MENQFGPSWAALKCFVDIILNFSLLWETGSWNMNFWNVSQGKDVRINLEYNLAMSEVLGRPGWLYNETKALHDEGAILSCSGDSPFQLRLLKGVSSDVSCLSKMCLYVSDPADISNPPVKQTKKTPLNIRKKWKEGGWFFRQLSIMLLAEEQNWSLTSTNASQKTLSFFSNPLSIHALICCIWLSVQSKVTWSCMWTRCCCWKTMQQYVDSNVT